MKDVIRQVANELVNIIDENQRLKKELEEMEGFLFSSLMFKNGIAEYQPIKRPYLGITGTIVFLKENGYYLEIGTNTLSVRNNSGELVTWESLALEHPTLFKEPKK